MAALMAAAMEAVSVTPASLTSMAPEPGWPPATASICKRSRSVGSTLDRLKLPKLSYVRSCPPMFACVEL